MTAATLTQEGQTAVFIAIDHFTAECVGIHAAKRAPGFEALEPVRQGVRARLRAVGKDATEGLSLRHDHGTQYMSHDFQNEIRWLGIASSPAFVRPPEGNGCDVAYPPRLYARHRRVPGHGLIEMKSLE